MGENGQKQPNGLQGKKDTCQRWYEAKDTRPSQRKEATGEPQGSIRPVGMFKKSRLWAAKESWDPPSGRGRGMEKDQDRMGRKVLPCTTSGPFLKPSSSPQTQWAPEFSQYSSHCLPPIVPIWVLFPRLAAKLDAGFITSPFLGIFKTRALWFSIGSQGGQHRWEQGPPYISLRGNSTLGCQRDELAHTQTLPQMPCFLLGRQALPFPSCLFLHTQQP